MAVAGTKTNVGRNIFNTINATLLSILAIATLYPFLYVASSSFTSEKALMVGKIGIIPEDLSLLAYKIILNYPLIPGAYKNTILYTVLGVIVNLLLTTLGAYPLSRDRFKGKNLFMFIIAFTMLFHGGIIPTFIVVRNLHLINSIWAMVLPSAINTFNLIVMRTFFQQIPVDIEEAAAIDGCNDLQTLFKIILPMSIPSIMTIGLFYAVQHWNSFFPALIYLNERKLFPLQIILRDIVIQNRADDLMSSGENVMARESIKYATIMVATVPILMVYPFIQKYFVKGVMIGAIKG